MSEYVFVAEVDEIKPGQRKIIDFEDVTVAVLNVGGNFYCIEDICTHDGGPVAEGKIDGFTIECPRHGALFDIRDGRVLTMPAVVPMPTYDVKLEGNQIMVASPDEW